MSKYQICINSVPTDRVKFIRALRLAGRIGLKQADELAIYFERFRHSVLVAGLDLPIAEHLAKELRESGADVEVQDSVIGTPMLCAPQVNKKYIWGRFNSLKKAAGFE